MPHAELGQALVVVARRLPGSTLSEAEVLAACRRTLPNFMQPARVVFRDDMPQNPNGKLNRQQLHHDYATLFSAE